MAEITPDLFYKYLDDYATGLTKFFEDNKIVVKEVIATQRERGSRIYHGVAIYDVKFQYGDEYRILNNVIIAQTDTKYAVSVMAHAILTDCGIRLFVELLRGKYQGSVGILEITSIYLGTPEILNNKPYHIKALSPKSLRIRTDVTHPYLVIPDNTVKILDMSGNVTSPGDLILHNSSGNNYFAVFKEYNNLNGKLNIEKILFDYYDQSKIIGIQKTTIPNNKRFINLTYGNELVKNITEQTVVYKLKNGITS